MNPVLKREFLTSLRTTRALALGIVFLWMLGLLVVFMWPAEGVYSMADQSSRKLFVMLSMGFLALVSLCAPSFTAVSISGEKEADTYDLLYDTLLTPGDIIFGKLAAGVGYVLILLACSLPMSGACYVLGGVSVGDLLYVYLIVLVAALFFGMLGMYISSVCRTSYRSLIFCYIAIVSVCGLTWVPSVILAGTAESFHPIHAVRALSPFAAMMSVVLPNSFSAEHPLPASGFGLIADGPLLFLALGVLGAFVLLALAWRVVSKPPLRATRNDGDIIEGTKDLIKRKLGFPFYLFDPRKRKRMIGSIINLMAIKEMRTKAFGRISWLIRAMSACFIISLVMAFLPLQQVGKIGVVTVVFTCIAIPLAIIVLLCPVLTASGISDERESGVFEMLRATRISAWTIVMGKLQVSWLFTFLLLASVLPTFFVLAYLSCGRTDMEHLAEGLNAIVGNFDFSGGFDHISQVNSKVVLSMLSAFGVMASSMFFATNVGLFVSSICKRTSNATAIAYGIVLCFAVGTLVPYLIADSLPGSVVEMSLMLNPFAAAAKAVSTEVFPDLSSTLWLKHIVIVCTVALAFMVATIFRVWTLMKPSK